MDDGLIIAGLVSGLIGFIWWRIKISTSKIDNAISKKEFEDFDKKFMAELEKNNAGDMESRKEIWIEMRKNGERLATLEALIKK